MSISHIFLTLLQLLLITLLIVWWVRWTPRGLGWVTVSLFIAIGLSYLSSSIFRVPPYQVGCEGLCPGWRGYPIPTHRVEAGNIVFFDAVSFVRNVLFYYAVFLSFSAVVIWFGRQFRWRSRSWAQRILFVLIVIFLPLAITPLWAHPPQPAPPPPADRLVVNAARDWQWQLRLRGFMDRSLALEDVRWAPDGGHQRVCFRSYTWFYIPWRHIFIDLEPAGVKAVKGGEIPLSDSCWTQP